MSYHCKKFCGNTAETICSRCAVKAAQNSQLLEELTRRIKLKEIRFNYDGRKIGEDIGGLVSWDATDKYDLDFAELEEYLAKNQEQ